MWGEQLAKAKAAVESGSAEAIMQSSTVFLATAALYEQKEEEEEGGRSIGAAALFYPRPASRHAPPHLYVELMVSSAPGKGLGGLLLRYVEEFAAANAERLGGNGAPRIEQIRLLGVESAKGFYGRCGYREDEDAGGGDDDEKELKYRRKEMVKQISGGGKQQQQQESCGRAAVVLVAAAAGAADPGHF
jgi:GNAT superfamily N-acetyltransferase